MESEFMKIVLAEIDFYKNLPMGLVTMDPNNPW